jgi:hypothetical protein
MIRPFKKAQGRYTHVLVVIDKFTEWIEYKPISSLTSAKAVEFIQDIIFRFGIRNSIIIDLGSNFTSSEFFDFLRAMEHPDQVHISGAPKSHWPSGKSQRNDTESTQKKSI